MPMPSSGIIVVEKPSTASNSRITTTNTSKSSNTNRCPPHNHHHFHHHHHHQHHQNPLQQQKQQHKTHIQYYEYYEANENQQLSSQQQQQQQPTIVVDGCVFQNKTQSQQQQHSIQLGEGRKLHTTSLSTLTSSSTALTSTSLSITSKSNLNIQSIKAGPMPQITKQLPQQQQQQIIQHTSHTTATTTSSCSASNNSNSSQQQQQQHHHHQQLPQQQHVQQVQLASTSTAQQQHLHHHPHHHQQQQQATQQHQGHMIQVSEEYLEQAPNPTAKASNMMISATGEVIQQQQIFKIVSTDAATGNMIIDTSGTNQNPNATTTTSKVLLSNLTVLSKQQAGGTTMATGGHQQQSSATAQTINFVNAKQLYTASSAATANPAGSAGVVAANLGSKQQKFTVAASANLGGNFKAAALKQTNNTQYVHQSTGSQQKISMTTGNRNMQMLTTTRVQNASNSVNHSGVISSSPTTAQTMVLQQPHKFLTSNNAVPKSSALGPCGNVIKKTTGTLRMSNSNNTATVATKMMNNLQAHSTHGVKTFITQTAASAQQQQQQQQQQQNNPNNQLSSLQQHHGKGGKSKFVKQYNNAILNSAGAVAIATLPHQQQQQNTINISGQQQQQQQHHQQSFQAQSTFMNHHKTTGVTATTKINKINSKYATANVAAQLPPGTQLHQKTITHQTAHQQPSPYQTSNNSNIKFVNAQGTIIQQQQPLTPQKIHIKQQQQPHQSPYQTVQNFDTVDGSTAALYSAQHHQTTNAATGGGGGTGTGPSGNSSLLTDDIMMVNGTQMTDELSARILQSMSQKSFINQRYQQLQQQHHPVFQKSPTTNNNSNNMLPPTNTSNAAATSTSQQQQSASPSLIQNSPNSHSNILLSPRELTLYPSVGSIHPQQTPPPQQPPQTQPSSPNHYSGNASSASGGGSLAASAANYMSSSMATITPHSGSGVSIVGGSSSSSSSSSRLAQSAPNSRSQSMERKLHESSMSRKSTEYYKVNNHSSLRGSHSNIATAQSAAAAHTGTANGAAASSTLSSAASGSPLTTIMGSGIAGTTTTALPSRPPSIPPSALMMESQSQLTTHLQATKILPGANNSSNDDEDIIGEEVRPVPVETTDIRLQILHAVLLDHTYANPMPLELPTTFAVQLPPPSQTNIANVTPGGHMTAATLQSQQHWSLGGICAVTAATGSGVTAAGVVTSNYPMYSSQLSRLQQDDDAHSAISNSSRLALGDIDPGEETETAPEAEAEDDSETRCICELPHDDGYMICCDKCSCWQHVDCMGIDRQNIPEEYLCEICQPRDVDKARARSLQIQKRKEQQTQLMLAQAQAAAAASTMGAAGSASGNGGVNQANVLTNDVLAVQQRLTVGSSAFSSNPSDPSSIQLLTSGGTTMKKGTKMLKKIKESTAGKKSKKAEKMGTVGSGMTGGKATRKETKKSTKRKKAGHEGGSTVGMTAAEKHAANLRQWIENYELAVTNHYSPELRARLHAITKQPSLLQSILNTENPVLKEFSMGNLENRATTVPHAGGKILISNLDITPNSPICELRGKYMLTTQYKTQNTSMNMNTPPPNNYHLASYKAHKTPGPFIFFYQLHGAEVTVNQGLAQTTTTTTLNPDGTFTTTTTTLPAQLSPPTCLKGPEICVDTRTYGNEARFVRRSCRPNAEIQHLFEKGTIHLFIVALTDIRASTEITIRHEPHDLLAVDNKKSNAMVIQPTSTPCACGLSKDCIFGPPLPQMPPAAKSNAGRKSLALNGGGSSGTAKQRKANQQNLNRNRSTSSSGDSNMGSTMAMAPIPTVALSLNSPNNLLSAKMSKNQPVGNNNGLLPLTASCNSNLSNASSTSSTLTSIMQDSGICTSSSSPSVSIPSPTQHMHSPIQQVPAHHQQQHLRPVQIQPQQQQQQQLMQSLPTPLILTTDVQQQQQQPVHPQPLQQLQHQQSLQQPQQPLQQQVLLHSPQQQLQPQQQHQQQPLTVIAQAASATLDNQEIGKSQPEQAPGNLYITPLQPQQQQLQLTSPQQSFAIQSASSDAASPEASIAVSALQSLNCAPSNSVTAAVENLQQSQIVVQPSTDMKVEEQHQQPTTPSTEDQILQSQPSAPSVIAATTTTSTSTTGTVSASTICSSASTSPHQQKSSPQKNNQSHQNNTHPGRKTPAKQQARTTSFSEDNDHHNDDNAVSTTPNSSSTPKEKPKLSREDRKMEAILRAIEKMERNQQRKQEQKQAKRQNSGSHNTTPTSPNKSLDSAESSGTKRSNSQSAGGPTRTKKKRKSGSRGAAHNNQRKRRQSRMNSHESIEGSGPHEHDTVTSESDGCTAMHSPPIQTVAALKQLPPAITENMPNNVDQAAGLLMAFANPNVPPTQSPTAATVAEPQSPQRPPTSTSQYIISPPEATASPPPTPPSQVSSACLLIEAAVGPLESNLEPNFESNSADINNAEFKYPLQAKTKKLLMNNWLHQTEETSAGVPLEQSSTSQIACVAGGLDSLVQAAMSDFKQTHTEESEQQPQNLSIVAQRVEEFIQQTEGGPPTPPPAKHSYEYEQQQHQMYAMAANPAVDLSLKQAVVHDAHHPPANKNFHLPLQVSTCSNNSSVKKRWLRQAISEETHEESQNNYSMSPSPTTPMASATNNTVNPQVQTVTTPICSPALTTINLPNGFTTPLKKRRLLLTDKDEEENMGQNTTDPIPSTPLSPPPVESAMMHQDPNEYEEEKPEIYQNHPQATHPDVQEDADVDVEKCEQHEPPLQEQHAIEQDQEQDVDIISPPLEEEIKSEIVTKHESKAEIKVETTHHVLQSAVGASTEFNDQEDDVDILRSPSPGREMIKAEDNLVKIEPEDTSGNDDVKIDVEREESMAADDVIVPQLKREYKEESIQPIVNELKVERLEVKQEHTTENNQDIPSNEGGNIPQCVTKSECNASAKFESSAIKQEEELDEQPDIMEEPKPKRLKLEDNTVVEHKMEKDEPKSENEVFKKENSEAGKTKQEGIVQSTKESIKSEKLTNEAEKMPPSTSSTSSVMKNGTKVTADSNFSTIESTTPPPPPAIPSQPIQTCTSSVTTSTLQRSKALTDDDIQARLHSFHKENILFLQSRNKKSKSSNSTSSSTNSMVSSDNHHRNNNNKSNSTSSNASHHYHHHHEGKERSEKSNKLSTKHHKNSSSSSSGSSKKQKLHKRERTTSSSSSSNSHKNSIAQISSTTTINKNAVISSSTNSLSSTSSSSSSSSKKLKSLKKSSSGSSTSSTNSSSSSALQNCHPSTSDNKPDKHQRQRTISNSSTSFNASTSSSTTSQTPLGNLKKRQLNFELELTKDMHLVNSVPATSGKHKRLEESLGHASVKKSRKDSSSTAKEEQKNGSTKSHKLNTTVHVEKSQEKEKKTSAVAAKSSPTSCSSLLPHTVAANAPTAFAPEEVKPLTSVTTTPAATILREHPTLPHFNNVILTPGTNSLLTPSSLPPQATVATPTLQPQPPPPQTQPPPPTAPSIPNHVNNPSFVATQSPLPSTASPPPGSAGSIISSPLLTPALNSSSNNLPFFNTIYGKLLDSHSPSLSSPGTAVAAPLTAAATTPSVATTGVLSEYLDTKLKSYNTLGGYVSHTALFGLNNTPVKDVTLSKDAVNEMPAPPAPTSVPAATLSLSLNASVSPNVAALKIHTKTASHDPRLNPHLTAPEPPPQPKRKLSINEYRKRMQQSSSIESASNSLPTTPTTPLTPIETPSSVGAGVLGSNIAAVVINKCTLNSPERLTQSVDSQIQKEIIASSSLSVYDSHNSSNSSSTSNSSLLNEALLKPSSSLVEEDSTKGQFNAAPTLLEKQQESLCARLKSLKEKQGLALGVGGAASGSRTRFSSFTESVGSGSIGEYSLRKDDSDLEMLGKRNHSISSSIGGGDSLDNCLEEISSTSTSMSSSREPSPERYTTTSHQGKHVLTASATTTMATNSSSSISNVSGGLTKQQQEQQQHNTGDKNSLSTNLERKKSVDIA